MKKFNLILFFLFGIFHMHFEAQGQRYLTPDFFNSHDLESDIVYGSNYTVLSGTPTLEDLEMDVYQPAGDTETARPLVLLFHSGSFLPSVPSGLPTGDKTDSSLVDIATKLARRGFVVASCNYRLGWNPLAPSQDPLLFGIMNAAYRGIQDTRTAIRYFKKSHDVDGNPYGIDPTKIVVWGNGTGGFLSLGAATLDSWDVEINQCCPDNPAKFYVNLGWGEFVVVKPDINGDIYGTSVGISPPPPHVFPQGDTLSRKNWESYSSDFQMAVNLGGAVPDSSWIDENTVPTVSFHVKEDQLTPCKTGIVSSQGIDIIEVSGSCDYQKIQNQLGNNDDWVFHGDIINDGDSVWVDEMSTVANTRNYGREGFFPLETDPALPNQLKNNAPWDYWPANFPTPLGWWPLDEVRAKATCDSIISYFAPRACITLGLGCDLFASDYLILDIDEILAQKIDLQTSPNPAIGSVHFTTKEFPMQRIQIYDLTGRLVRVHADVNSYEFEMQKGNLGNGIYFAQVWFEDGFLSKQIIFQE